MLLFGTGLPARCAASWPPRWSPCPTGSIHHTTEFEGADYSLESLIRRFVTDPVMAYKPKKGPETDPQIAPILNRGMTYLDQWAQPGGEKPVEEEPA